MSRGSLPRYANVAGGRSGVAQLAEALGDEHPVRGCRMCAGYSDDGIIRRGLFDPGVVFLDQPFTTRRLASAVRNVLDALRR